MLNRLGKSFRVGKKSRAVVCECPICGSKVIVELGNYRRNKSCGCLCGEQHSDAGSIEYTCWSRMIKRCENPGHERDSRNYRDRGITVCERWRNSFLAFLADMGRRPSPLHSIDRIENNAGYSKENCRWATVSEQAKNRRSTIRVTIDGETKCLKDWARSRNLPYMRVYKRYVIRKWDIRRALEMT